jgi:hypothetical protein
MGGPDGIDGQAGMTDQVIYLGHLGRFLVGGVWFNLQDPHFLTTYIVVFFINMLG